MYKVCIPDTPSSNNKQNAISKIFFTSDKASKSLSFRNHNRLYGQRNSNIPGYNHLTNLSGVELEDVRAALEAGPELGSRVGHLQTSIDKSITTVSSYRIHLHRT